MIAESFAVGKCNVTVTPSHALCVRRPLRRAGGRSHGERGRRRSDQTPRRADPADDAPARRAFQRLGTVPMPPHRRTGGASLIVQPGANQCPYRPSRAPAGSADHPPLNRCRLNQHHPRPSRDQRRLRHVPHSRFEVRSADYPATPARARTRRKPLERTPAATTA